MRTIDLKKKGQKRKAKNGYNTTHSHLTPRALNAKPHNHTTVTRLAMSPATNDDEARHRAPGAHPL
jgi:hypothetical protein